MITGSVLRDAFISAANNISNHKQKVNALNVFPVPDGDTGTNMSMTISAAKREVQLMNDSATVAEVSKTAAGALLRGARGNSGVILSLLFRGFSKSLAGKAEATAEDLVKAMEAGVAAAYKAVMKPTEGTILTVARVAREEGEKALTPDSTETGIWRVMIDGAKDALEKTPELLPVLKKAGVVDAGGAGLVYVMEGMEQVFLGGEIIPLEEETAEAAPNEIPDERNAAGLYEGKITFTYCTEFIVLKDAGRADALKLRAYLESIGDSAVVVDDDDIIKCHVHTDNPGDALQQALQHGALTKIKIENMREQHADNQKAVREAMTAGFTYAPVDPSNRYGFVSVCAGDGVEQLFHDLGVANVVKGGQTMNPSTDDILSAVHATPAKTVFVLPNNKNIIMAAEQAINLADREVRVLPTRTIPEGLSAMLVFDESVDAEQNQLDMTKAAERVSTGQVTFAARDSEYDGHKIREGEILAIENGKVTSVEKDIIAAAVKVTKSMVKKHRGEASFITIIYGEDATEEQAAQVEAEIREKVDPDIEVAIVDGGTPIYYFTISVE
ncbi:MAG: DAK2 domain-containing protein [Clostridiales bacterium]|nr:DAK2 domain-containing protein [Clostridiales bacterium]